LLGQAPKFALTAAGAVKKRAYDQDAAAVVEVFAAVEDRSAAAATSVHVHLCPYCWSGSPSDLYADHPCRCLLLLLHRTDSLQSLPLHERWRFEIETALWSH
jgi:hypothetical protein